MSVAPRCRYSVALCTYNGSRFLAEQLASIRAQTRLPDELIVCDDASTDNTVSLLESFARGAPFPVRVFTQPVNAGSTRNFERALRQCSGELIALSDQDDIWSPERLAASEEFLHEHPEAAFVFTDGELIDERGEALKETLWETFHFTPPLQARMAGGDYSVLLRHRFITGATVTLRASLLARVLPFPASWVHDEWLAAVTSLVSGIGLLPRPLLQYRVHPAQQVGATRQRKNSSAAHWAHVERANAQMRDLLARMETLPSIERADLVEAYRQRAGALARRMALPEARLARTAQVARNLSDYSAHAAGRWSAVKDILLYKPAHIAGTAMPRMILGSTKE